MNQAANAISQSIPVVEVIAAVILRADGEFLLTQRPVGKVYAGYWEFPGGKVESGESLLHALERELWEELGICVTQAYPWITRIFTYAHATVRLHFFRVMEWDGDFVSRENQALAWQTPDQITVSPILPANDPILRALLLPPVYVITRAAEIGVEASLQQIERAFQNGLRLLQIREKQMSRDTLWQFAKDVLSIACRYNAKVLVNGEIALVQPMSADGVHLTAAQLLSLTSRPVSADRLCSASCHNAEELFAAEQLGLDFVVLGPVQPTLTHPGLSPLGWRRFVVLIRDYPLPVYALGGLSAGDLVIAQEMGAHGIAMMRGVI